MQLIAVVISVEPIRIYLIHWFWIGSSLINAANVENIIIYTPSFRMLFMLFVTATSMASRLITGYFTASLLIETVFFLLFISDKNIIINPTATGRYVSKIISSGNLLYLRHESETYDITNDGLDILQNVNNR